MSRRSSRLSAKSKISYETPEISSIPKRRTRTANKAKINEETEILVKTNVKTEDINSESSNEDTCTTEESDTTVKTSYYSSPGKRKSSSENDENHMPTTPKQRKLSDEEDNGFFSPKTPSTLLSQLILNSPMRKEDNKNSAIKKSLWPANNIYQDAKKALHSTTPETLPGRQKEFEDLRVFINEHLEEKKSGSLYISGPPGTGKTACLTLILEKANVSQINIKTLLFMELNEFLSVHVIDHILDFYSIGFFQ